MAGEAWCTSLTSICHCVEYQKWSMVLSQFLDNLHGDSTYFGHFGTLSAESVICQTEFICSINVHHPLYLEFIKSFLITKGCFLSEVPL